MAVPNVTLPRFEWGEYTPTLTIVANIKLATLLLVASSARFTRMGDITRVSLAVTVEPTGAGATSFDISLPIASDFTAAGDCNGVANNDLGEPGYVSANTTNDRARVTFTSVNGDPAATTIVFAYRNL